MRLEKVFCTTKILDLFMGSGGGGAAPASSGPDYIYVPDNSYRPEPQPAPQPVTPIGSHGGLYGDGPRHGY